MSQYFGLECDSDDEIEEDESDAECFSDDQIVRKSIDYDLEKMFEIITKRDFKNWSMSTIHHHYKKVSEGSTGKMQLTRYCFLPAFYTNCFAHNPHVGLLRFRMRNYVKRGSISSRVEYAKLREDVWNEVYSLDKEGAVLHDTDIQQIAMIKAKERNLHDFKVYNVRK